MRSSHRIPLEIHALHELARLAEARRDGALHIGVSNEFQPGVAEPCKTATAEALDVENRVQRNSFIGKYMPFRISSASSISAIIRSSA
jgi:hypothetical protein